MISSDEETAIAQNDRAIWLATNGSIHEAMMCARQNIDHVRRSLGSNHIFYAAALLTLANMQASRDPHAAESLVAEAVSLRRRFLGENHPEYAKALAELGRVDVLLGRARSGQRQLQEALEIVRATCGRDDPRCATILEDLAKVSLRMGDPHDANILIHEALAIYDRHPELPTERAAALGVLAVVLGTVGEHPAAEAVLRRADDLASTEDRARSLEPARRLSTLASTRYALGDFSAAVSLYIRALTHLRAIHAPARMLPIYFDSLSGLGAAYFRQGDFARAESCLSEAVAVTRDLVGLLRHHHLVAQHNLATVYVVTGRRDRARAILAACVATAINEEETRDSAYLEALHSLAVVESLDPDSVASARKHFAMCLEGQERSRGVNDCDRALTLMALAQLQAATGELGEAVATAIAAVHANNGRLVKLLFGGTEAQLSYAMERVDGDLDQAVSLMNRCNNLLPSQLRDIADLSFQRKGFLLEVAVIQGNLTSRRGDGSRDGHRERLHSARRELVEAIWRDVGRSIPERGIEELERWAGDLEGHEIVVALRGGRERCVQGRIAAADVEGIANALPQGSLLLEYVKYRETKGPLVPTVGWLAGGEDMYGVFTLGAHAPQSLAWKVVGRAAVVDELITACRRAIVERRRETLENVTRELAMLLLHPVLSQTGRPTRLIICPDGQLALLPFGVLPWPGNVSVVQSTIVEYVGSGRDLVPRRSACSKTSQSIVVADPCFGSPKAMTSVVGQSSGRRGEVGLVEELIREQILPAESLPGTAREGEAVAKILGDAALFSGTGAVKRSLMAAEAPRVVHLATHGFFVGDVKPAASRDLFTEGLAGVPTFERTAADPLLRSGLLLTGANEVTRDKEGGCSATDGILTAREVLDWDLAGTELVVLSACDTGLGEVRKGQGVYGLRRAFAIAGARALVMSLWKVADDETAELMGEFYGRLARGLDAATALHEAQLAMRERYADPFYWAAFICQRGADLRPSGPQDDATDPDGKRVVSLNEWRIRRRVLKQ